MLLDTNNNLTSKIQAWKSEIKEINSEFEPVEIPKIVYTDLIDEKFVLRRMNTIDSIKNAMENGFINGKTGTATNNSTSSYWFNYYQNKIHGCLKTSSDEYVRIAITGVPDKLVNSISSIIYFNTDSKDRTTVIRKIVTGRRSHSRKESSALLINEFTIDYDNNTTHIRADSDKRFTEKALEIYMQMMAPIVEYVNGSVPVTMVSIEQPKKNITVFDINLSQNVVPSLLDIAGRFEFA